MKWNTILRKNDAQKTSFSSKNNDLCKKVSPIMQKVAKKFGRLNNFSYLRAAIRQTFSDYEERAFGNYE